MSLDNPAAPAQKGQTPREDLIQKYKEARAFTEKLCEPLETEDYVVQTMPDVSPTKWHIAHTSWFFDQFILRNYLPNYKVFHPRYNYLFNSYYNSIGPQHCRPRRGTLSRPTVKEVFEYRAWVDQGMHRLLEQCGEATLAEVLPLVELGVNHEQQHQELMVTDIKNVLAANPLYPVYRDNAGKPSSFRNPASLKWHSVPGGIYRIGHEGPGFAFDNETPRHDELLHDFRLASRPVTCGEFLEFMEDGGYHDSLLWLSEGWATVQEQQWNAPFYWEKRDDGWYTMTLGGLRPIDPAEPVCHVSYYEADAFARWAGARLPTEAEWEVASMEVPVEGNFVDSGNYQPRAAEDSKGIAQMFGDVWEWTMSHYSPYPGYEPPKGAIGEYNGKFMCNQFVLRGGSCATPQSHIRRSYRNFFHAGDRWQFKGFRLAKDGK